MAAAADEEMETLISNQQLELLAARDADTDLDLAFRLQMQEAMAASLAFHPSSSSASSVPLPLPASPSSSASFVSLPLPASPSDDPHFSDLIALQTLEFDRFRQEKADADRSRQEMDLLAADLRRRAHDERVAREILRIPDDEWEDRGDWFERPFQGVRGDEERPFRLYFKGMATEEVVRGGAKVPMAAIGVALCDPEDRVVFEIGKPVIGAEMGREFLEIKGLMEGMNAVITLGIKRVDAFCDYRALVKHVTGQWDVKQRKLATLIDQVLLLQRKIENFQIFLVPRCNIKFVFKLAREVIDSRINKNIEQLNDHKDLKETCKICLEDIDSPNMFAVGGCLHHFCFSCMRQHVEVKLLHGMLPACPHDGCNINLNVESCRKFLSPKLLDIMTQRIKEASIPVTEKVYCPYPKCSALMSASEAITLQQESSSKQPAYGTSGLRKCIKCSGSFCIWCKVPWHDRMSCYDFKRLNPHHRAEDAKIKSLARQKLWRQCVKCNHMIELAEGCFHMTCRCGYEFCYTCGAEWRNKKATCSCPLWDERNILYDDEYDDSDDDDDDDYNDMGYRMHGYWLAAQL